MFSLGKHISPDTEACLNLSDINDFMFVLAWEGEKTSHYDKHNLNDEYTQFK